MSAEKGKKKKSAAMYRGEEEGRAKKGGEVIEFPVKGRGEQLQIGIKRATKTNEDEERKEELKESEGKLTGKATISLMSTQKRMINSEMEAGD